MKHLVLIFCGFLCVLSGFCQPSQQGQVGAYTYNFYDNNNTCVLTDIVEDVSGELTLPATVVFNEKTYAVTSIGNPEYNYFGNTPYNHVVNVTKLIISEGVQKITCSFKAFQHVRSIVVPSTVTSLAYGSFSFGLSGGYLDEIWSELGGAINNTYYDLERVEILTDKLEFKSIDGVLFSQDGKTLLLCPRGRKGEYTVPDGVERLNTTAFRGCNQLTKITLPSSIQEIGECPVAIDPITAEWNWSYSSGYGAFYWCTKLTELQLPDVEYLEGNLLRHCWALESLVIPSTVKWIASNALSLLGGLKTIDWNDCNLEAIQGGAASFTSMINGYVDRLPEVYSSYAGPNYILSLPFHVKRIETNAFVNCLAPESLVLSPDLEYLGIRFVQFYHENSKATTSERLAPVKAIYNYRTEPLDVEEGVFGFDEVRVGRKTELRFPQTWADNCVLYVPVGSVDAYKAHNIWGRFKNIQEFDATNIQLIGKSSNTRARVYDVMGRSVNEIPQKGLYIINGKKVVVK